MPRNRFDNDPGEMVVKVQKQALIDALTKNRDQHKVIFEEAMEGFAKMAQETLEKNLEAIRKGKPSRSVQINLPLPVNHIKDYDRVIKMLEMHQAADMDIPESEFQKYVMDDWDWRREFYIGNSQYSVQAAALATNGDF